MQFVSCDLDTCLSAAEQGTEAIGCQLDLLEGNFASVEILTIQLSYGHLIIKTESRTKKQKT